MSELILPKPEPKKEQIERHDYRAGEAEVKARQLVRDAAQTVKPRGCNYIGFATVYFYKDREDSCTMVPHTSLDRVPEVVANHGVKELARSMMQVYGHKPPEKRG